MTMTMMVIMLSDVMMMIMSGKMTLMMVKTIMMMTMLIMMVKAMVMVIKISMVTIILLMMIGVSIMMGVRDVWLDFLRLKSRPVFKAPFPTFGTVIGAADDFGRKPLLLESF